MDRRSEISDAREEGIEEGKKEEKQNNNFKYILNM